ncbi:MAG: eukaryotic-like serine/threonine-protein kinase, partial [Miltoncostaeaceae bacterium]|nr:eukaryotic-like serine/threonine-protein kinase [Miltoncostaeaceae bacterium]
MIDQHPTQPTVPSQVVLGRYRLGPLIGRGATARVYRARDVSGGGEVAVKVVPAELDSEGRAAAEVRAAARLSHPGLVRLLDWGDDGEAVHLVWELIEGPSLARTLAAQRPGGPERDAAVTEVIADVLDALEHVHSRGVIHRDVKPANILVDDQGRGRLSDLGVARLSGEAGLTATGAVVGTLAYMAPEQATGGLVSGAADVYAASLTLYEALAGANPIAGGSPAETLRRAGAAAVPPLEVARPDLPPALCAAVDAGLARS